MKIKISHLPLAYDEGSIEEAAKRVAKDFGVLVEVTSQQGPGGWPEVSLIGTPKAIIKALVAEGGWSTGGGEDEEDYEMVYYYMRDAVEVYS